MLDTLADIAKCELAISSCISSFQGFLKRIISWWGFVVGNFVSDVWSIMFWVD